MIKVAITDDELLFRMGMKELLDDGKTIQFIMEAGNGIELLEKLEVATELPDVLLLDFSMPGMNGMETFIKVREKYPLIKILMLSVMYNNSYIVSLIEKGANGYLSKNTEPEEIRKALATVVSNDYYFNSDTIAVMHQRLAGKLHKVALPDEPITNREKEVLELICTELTAGEIADKLYLSKRTVEGHRNNLLLKTGCKNTAGLVIYAIKNNFYQINKT